MSKKWQYKRIVLETEAIDHRSADHVMEDALNVWGSAGWELVQVIVFTAFSLAVFKQEVG